MVNYKKKEYKPKKSNRIQNLNTAMGVASKALAIGIATKKLLNVEKKFHDIHQASTFDGANYSLQLLNGIAQGDTGETRDGDQVKLLSLTWRGLVSNNLATSPLSYRMIIFQDRQCDSSDPTPGDLLQDAGTTSSVFSQLNMDNKMRFKVLHDEFYFLEAKGVGSRSIHHTKGYTALGAKDQGIKVRYGGTGSTIGDVNSNPIYCLMLSNESPASQTSNVGIRWRVRYVDN